eukprot:1052459-Pyramimonas_sp.AAC.1
MHLGSVLGVWGGILAGPGQSMRALVASGVPLEACVGYPGSFLAAVWGRLRAFWGHLGAFSGAFEA